MCSDASSKLRQHASSIFACFQERLGRLQDDLWTDVVGRPVGRYEPRHAVTRNVKQSLDDNHIHGVLFF